VLIEGNIFEVDVTDAIINKVDYIVNFVFESHAYRSLIKTSSFVMSNVLGTQVL
jgi:dTDP-D-glucose 4,6-dehydratase